MMHGGFIPDPGDEGRRPSSSRSARPRPACQHGVTLGLETGQETADLLRRTLDDLQCDNLKVNFDPANRLLYDMGDPTRAIEIDPPKGSRQCRTWRRFRVARSCRTRAPPADTSARRPARSSRSTARRSWRPARP